MYVPDSTYSEFVAEAEGPVPAGRPDLFDRLVIDHGHWTARTMWGQMCSQYDYEHSEEYEQGIF